MARAVVAALCRRPAIDAPDVVAAAAARRRRRRAAVAGTARRRRTIARPWTWTASRRPRRRRRGLPGRVALSTTASPDDQPDPRGSAAARRHTPSRVLSSARAAALFEATRKYGELLEAIDGVDRAACRRRAPVAPRARGGGATRRIRARRRRRTLNSGRREPPRGRCSRERAEVARARRRASTPPPPRRRVDPPPPTPTIGAPRHALPAHQQRRRRRQTSPQGGRDVATRRRHGARTSGASRSTCDAPSGHGDKLANAGHLRRTRTRTRTGTWRRISVRSTFFPELSDDDPGVRCARPAHFSDAASTHARRVARRLGAGHRHVGVKAVVVVDVAAPCTTAATQLAIVHYAERRAADFLCVVEAREQGGTPASPVHNTSPETSVAIRAQLALPPNRAPTCSCTRTAASTPTKAPRTTRHRTSARRAGRGVEPLVLEARGPRVPAGEQRPLVDHGEGTPRRSTGVASG